MRLPSEIQLHQNIRLLIYRSHGLNGETALNSVIRVTEDREAATQEPFNRFLIRWEPMKLSSTPNTPFTFPFTGVFPMRVVRR